MKIVKLTMIALVLLSAGAQARWSSEDTYLQASYLALHAMDWSQTHHVVRKYYAEANPILGPHPTTGEINRYFIGTAVLHTAIAYALPKKQRRLWQRGTGIYQAGIIVHNKGLEVGLHMRF